MRNRSTWLIIALAIVVAGSVARLGARQAPAPEPFAGVWAGTYDGAASGTMEMVLEKGQDGALTGKVNVVSDGGNYSAELQVDRGRRIESDRDVRLPARSLGGGDHDRDLRERGGQGHVVAASEGRGRRARRRRHRRQ